jgi:hypothetical protein
MKRCKREETFDDLKKCLFSMDFITYLGYMVGIDGFYIKLEMIQVVTKLSMPTYLNDQLQVYHKLLWHLIVF